MDSVEKIVAEMRGTNNLHGASGQRVHAWADRLAALCPRVTVDMVAALDATADKLRELDDRREARLAALAPSGVGEDELRNEIARLEAMAESRLRAIESLTTARPDSVSEAAVERAARVVAYRAGEDYDYIGSFAQEVLKDTQRAALEAARAPGGVSYD